MMIRLSSDIKRLSEVYIYIYQKEAKLRNSPKFIGIVIQSNIRTIKPNTKYILDIAACQEELTHPKVKIERVNAKTAEVLFMDSGATLPESTITAAEEAEIETALQL